MYYKKNDDVIGRSPVEVLVFVTVMQSGCIKSTEYGIVYVLVLRTL